MFYGDFICKLNPHNWAVYVSLHLPTTCSTFNCVFCLPINANFVIIIKEKLHNRFNLISEEGVKIFKHNSETWWNRLKNKEVMTLWSFTNFHFLTSRYECKWVRWWCHHLAIFHSFCTQKCQKFHISAMRMLDLP